MWTGYAPQRLVEQEVTIMEAICACPCITTLVCMTMEARYEDNIKQGAREAEPLNSKAQMARHRFGARGNALTFPLPLEELFRALQDHATEVDGQQPLQLPRVGKELEHVVRVLLKTNQEGATTEQEIKTLIHQALVRREARDYVKRVCGFFFFSQGLSSLLENHKSTPGGGRTHHGHASPRAPFVHQPG